MEDNIKEEEINEKKPKKSKLGKIVLIVLLIFLLLIGGLVFWGYRKITAMGKPVDLGVEYTMQDYNDLVENIGIDVEAEKLCFDCPALDFSEPHEIDVVVSNSQAAAAFDIINEKLAFGRVSNTQIRFGEDIAEASTVFTYNGRDYPVYLSGNFEKASENTVSIDLFDLKVGGFNLPSGAQGMVEDAFVNLANERLSFMGDTFRIDEAGLTSEGLNFKGLVPTKAD